MFTTKKKQNGFTLIEILLVMLITSVLVLGVNAAFRQAHMLWSRAEKQRPVYQKTRLFFDTIRNELTCLYIPEIDDEQPAPFSLSASPDGTVRLSFLTMKTIDTVDDPCRSTHRHFTIPNLMNKSISNVC